MRLPKHMRDIYGTFRAFRQRKRFALRLVQDCFKRLQFGAYWCPDEALPIIHRIDRDLAELRRILGWKNWGH